MTRRICLIPDLLNTGGTFNFTLEMDDTVRALLAEIATPPIPVFPGRYVVVVKSRPLCLHYDISTAGLGATLEHEQHDGSAYPMINISRATFHIKQNWALMELKAGYVLRSIHHLRRHFFHVFFLVLTDHECLQHTSKIDFQPYTRRWMECLSSSNFRPSYRQG